MSKQLPNIRHNFTEYYIDRLIHLTLNERVVESAYIQGYMDALECLIGVALNNNAKVDELTVVPLPYIEDLLLQIDDELKNANFHTISRQIK